VWDCVRPRIDGNSGNSSADGPTRQGRCRLKTGKVRGRSRIQEADSARCFACIGCSFECAVETFCRWPAQPAQVVLQYYGGQRAPFVLIRLRTSLAACSSRPHAGNWRSRICLLAGVCFRKLSNLLKRPDPIEFCRLDVTDTFGVLTVEEADLSGSRAETDRLGEVSVPAEKLRGAQTQRSLEHFSIGKDAMAFRLLPRLTLAVLGFLAAAFLSALALGLPAMHRWLEEPVLALFPPMRGEGAGWTVDPSRVRQACAAAVRTLTALPAHTPSLRLLADRTAAALIGDTRNIFYKVMGLSSHTCSLEKWEVRRAATRCGKTIADAATP
jgi:hypothetical protein